VGDINHLERLKIQELGEELVASAEALRANAGGVDRDIPDVPYDWFGLRTMVVRLDEAREAFDQRVATSVAAAGEQAILQVYETSRADASFVLPLPRAAR
jgi:hypothetical protein